MDSSQQTTLYQPAVNGDIEITKILVMNKVNPNVEDLMNLTALYEAARNGHKEVVRFLMNNGANVKKNGALKLTPLHIAVANVDKAMVDCIIKNDKNIDENIEIVDVFVWSHVYWAVAKNDTLILEILLQATPRRKANVDIEDKLIGRSPLHIAATNGNMEAVELLINCKANVNHKDEWGWTPFDCAFAKNDVQMMNVLIGHGATIAIKDLCKILPTICPCNFFEIQHTLVQLEIYDEVMKLAGAEVLRYAAKHGNIQLVCTLLALGVNVNASNDVRLTALHQAAKYNPPEVVKILILYGANVNAQNDLGESPLTYAVERRNWIVVITLLCYGANPSLPDNCYETVRDLAERQGISNLLVEAEQRASAILMQIDSESSMLTKEHYICNT